MWQYTVAEEYEAEAFDRWYEQQDPVLVDRLAPERLTELWEAYRDQLADSRDWEAVDRDIRDYRDALRYG
jgi:hypothetical protein